MVFFWWDSNVIFLGTLTCICKPILDLAEYNTLGFSFAVKCMKMSVVS